MLSSRLATRDDLPVLVPLMDAAIAEGFTFAELMATLSGEPLNRTAGFEAAEHVTEPAGGTPIPLVKMSKSLVVAP